MIAHGARREPDSTLVDNGIEQLETPSESRRTQ